jgi:molybdate transport system substrate-binding protein
MGKQVAKLKVMSARSMHEAVTALAFGFTSESGNEVELDFGTVGALQKKLDAGETADVLIIGMPNMDALEKAGALVPGTRRELATARIGVAVREGEAPPDIATPAAFKQALMAARRIAFSDAAVGGSAGVYLARMFNALGLADMIKQKGLPQQSGMEVARRVASGEADIGMTLMPEIVPVKGARILGPLPKPLGLDTTYGIAVMATCAAPDAGRAFIAALTRPQAHDIWTEAGLDVAR